MWDTSVVAIFGKYILPHTPYATILLPMSSAWIVKRGIRGKEWISAQASSFKSSRVSKFWFSSIKSLQSLNDSELKVYAMSHGTTWLVGNCWGRNWWGFPRRDPVLSHIPTYTPSRLENLRREEPCLALCTWESQGLARPHRGWGLTTAQEEEGPDAGEAFRVTLTFLRSCRIVLGADGRWGCGGHTWPHEAVTETSAKIGLFCWHCLFSWGRAARRATPKTKSPLFPEHLVKMWCGVYSPHYIPSLNK